MINLFTLAVVVTILILPFCPPAIRFLKEIIEEMNTPDTYEQGGKNNNNNNNNNGTTRRI